MKTKKTNLLMLVLFAGILLLGSYMRNKSIYETTVIFPIRVDAREYLTYAYNLRFKGTYSKDNSSITNPERSVQPDAYRNPGYPLFISLFIERKPSNKNILDITFAQMIISSITLVIAFYVFQGILSIFWALAAAFLTAISPHLIAVNSYLLTETLFCFILVLIAAIARLFAERPSIFRAAGIGICIGCGFLVRPSLLYFPIVILVVFCIHFGRKRGIFYFIGLMVGLVVVVSPWFIRNLVTLRTISDQSLKVNFLHHGMYPDFTYNGDRNSFGYPHLFDPRSDEINRNTLSVLDEIIRRFQSQPVEHLLWFVFKKPIAFWSWNLVEGYREVFIYEVSSTPYQDNRIFRLSYWLARLLHWPIVGLAFMGLWISWFTGRPYVNSTPKMLLARYISALLIYFTLLHMAGAPFPRYAVPLRPLLYAMAMFTLSYCMDRFRNRIRPEPESSKEF